MYIRPLFKDTVLVVLHREACVCVIAIDVSSFGVYVDIPVFPTVTAIVTLDKYQPKTTPASKFLIPRDYKKVRVLES